MFFRPGVYRLHANAPPGERTPAERRSVVLRGSGLRAQPAQTSVGEQNEEKGAGGMASGRPDWRARKDYRFPTCDAKAGSVGGTVPDVRIRRTLLLGVAVIALFGAVPAHAGPKPAF